MKNSRRWDFRQREWNPKKFRSRVKDKGEDFVSDKGSNLVNSLSVLVAILLFSRQETCLVILIELWVDGKNLRVSCVELTYVKTSQIFKVSLTVLTYEETYEWIGK